MRRFGFAADETARAIDAGNASWGDLFKKSDFFSRYKWYLRVSVYASNAEELSSWYGPGRAVGGWPLRRH